LVLLDNGLGLAGSGRVLQRLGHVVEPEQPKTSNRTPQRMRLAMRGDPILMLDGQLDHGHAAFAVADEVGQQSAQTGGVEQREEFFQDARVKRCALRRSVGQRLRLR
jgi:acyl-coenzyme A thioesterase PaaI-like protein